MKYNLDKKEYYFLLGSIGAIRVNTKAGETDVIISFTANEFEPFSTCRIYAYQIPNHTCSCLFILNEKYNKVEKYGFCLDSDLEKYNTIEELSNFTLYRTIKHIKEQN
jgi:hypothetical protein